MEGLARTCEKPLAQEQARTGAETGTNNEKNTAPKQWSQAQITGECLGLA